MSEEQRKAPCKHSSADYEEHWMCDKCKTVIDRAELTRLRTIVARVEDVEGMWISVKDRLPEKRQEALFWFPNELGAIMMGRYLGEGRWSYGGLVYTSVTHWQLLPAPPQE